MRSSNVISSLKLPRMDCVKNVLLLALITVFISILSTENGGNEENISTIGYVMGTAVQFGDAK